MKRNRDWSRDELLLAFNLYWQIPFGSIHMRNPRIRELAQLLGRTVGSVSYKLANISRLDPALQKRGIRGMPHGSIGEEQLWEEFARDPESLALECGETLAQRVGKPLAEVTDIETDDLPEEGRDREAVVRVRVNQSFFRRRILSAYDYRCCITGLDIQPLLTASHIVPWAEDKRNRLNPRNGLCLNALHDRAFDRCLMWIGTDFEVRFSPVIFNSGSEQQETIGWLTSYEGKHLLLPKGFSPEMTFLKQHAQKCQEQLRRAQAN